MCSPSPPPAPDYGAAAREQGAANLEAARAQGRINNPNVVSPYGTQTVTWEGDTPTLRQTLSPEELAIYGRNAANRLGLADVAGSGLDTLKGLIGMGFDLSGAPGGGSAFTPGGPLSALDPSKLGKMPTAYSGPGILPSGPQSSEALRATIIQALNKRADDQYAQDADQINSDLVARGLQPGTKAYENEMDRLNRARNDYRVQAETKADEMVSNAFQRDLTRRQQAYQEALANAGLSYTQGMGIRQQGAAEQAQRFGQQGAAEQLRMAGQGQQFGQMNDLRRQYIAELLAQRQTPLNEIIALMGGSPVNNPFVVPGYAQNSQVAPAPIFGAATAQDAANMGRYNARVGSSNALMGGLFGLGSAALGAPVGTFV